MVDRTNLLNPQNKALIESKALLNNLDLMLQEIAAEHNDAMQNVVPAAPSA